MNELVILKSIGESETVIKSNENFVGMGLWNIGNELKYIRDNKTYADKKYKSFEEYVEKELDYSRSQTYNFISISENYSVHAGGQIGCLGIKKLLALTKIDEPQRAEFIANNPVNEMTTRELQQAIKDRDKAVKEKNNAENKFQTYQAQLDQARIDTKQLEDDKQISESKLKAIEGALQIEKDNLKKEKENSKEEIAKLQTFIGEAKVSGNDEEVIKLNLSLLEIQNDLDSSALKIDELEAQLKEKPIDVITAEPVIIEKIPEDIAKELEEYRSNSNQNTTQPVLKFKIYFEELQNVFRNELEVMDEIKKDYPEMHEKCKSAISNLISKMSERL